MSCKYTLPWPPSVNRYWRTVKGRVYVTNEGKQYRLRVADAVGGNRFGCTKEDRLSVCIWAYPPDRRKRDVDNMLKASLDAMQSAGVFPDDSQIDRLSIERKAVVDNGLLDVWIGIIQECCQ